MGSKKTRSGARMRLVARLGDAASLVGIGRMTAQIYALLLMTEGALSLDEMADLLGVSKASVSTHARKLAANGAIRRVWAPGARRDRYEAETDLRKVIKLWGRTAVERRLEVAGDVLREADAYLADAEAQAGTELPSVRTRLDAMRGLHGRLLDLVRALPALLGQGGEDAVA